MTKLAVLHHALGRFGGGEKLTIQHSMSMKEQGFDVDLFYGGPMIEDWRRKASSKISVRDFPFAFSDSAPNLSVLRKILKELEAFDIVLFHHHVDPLSAYYLTKYLKKRVMWYCGEPLRALWEDWLSGYSYKLLGSSVKATSSTWYGRLITEIFLSPVLYSFTVNFLRALDVRTVKCFNDIVANSRYTKGVVSDLYNVSREIPVVHPGVDMNFNSNPDLDPDPDPAVDGERNHKILFVGAMIPMKNHFNLIKAFHHLPPKVRSRSKLVIVGDGPERDSIHSMISRLNLWKNVIIWYNVTEPELEELYRECSFVANTTLHEPFGLVPLEAALFEKPSIVSNVGGMKEFVIPEETGIVVDPLDAESISKAMLRLIRDDDATMKMGARARERVIKDFRIERSTEKLAAIINGGFLD